MRLSLRIKTLTRSIFSEEIEDQIEDVLIAKCRIQTIETIAAHYLLIKRLEDAGQSPQGDLQKDQRGFLENL